MPHFMNQEESLLWDRIWNEFDPEAQKKIKRIEVEYSRDILGPCVYVRINLDTNFSFDLRDKLRRKIQAILDVEQPHLVSYIRFV